MLELQPEDNLVCPYCDFEYPMSIDEIRTNEGQGIENAETAQCEGCNEKFMIVEFDDYISIEEIEEDEDEDDDEIEYED